MGLMALCDDLGMYSQGWDQSLYSSATNRLRENLSDNFRCLRLFLTVQPPYIYSSSPRGAVSALIRALGVRLFTSLRSGVLRSGLFPSAEPSFSSRSYSALLFPHCPCNGTSILTASAWVFALKSFGLARPGFIWLSCMFINLSCSRLFLLLLILNNYRSFLGIFDLLSPRPESSGL